MPSTIGRRNAFTTCSRVAASSSALLQPSARICNLGPGFICATSDRDDFLGAFQSLGLVTGPFGGRGRARIGAETVGFLFKRCFKGCYPCLGVPVFGRHDSLEPAPG